MKMRQLLLCATAAIIACTPAAADPLPPDLAKAAADYDRAQISGSRELLEKLVASDYQLINSGGEVESRKQFIDEASAPTFKLDPFVVHQPVQTVWTDGAVLAGLVHATGTDSGKHFDVLLRFADIWAKRNGSWKVVFTEVTKAPAK